MEKNMEKHPLFQLALQRRGVPSSAWDKWNKAVNFDFNVMSARPKNEIEVIQSDGESTIYVYDFIGYDPWFGGVSAEEFAKAVEGVQSGKLNIRINSPGGYVNAGEAMAAAMERARKRCDVVAHNDGLCASAATFLLMAASEAVSSSGAEIMIHNAQTITGGDKRVHLARAVMLEKTDLTICDKYCRKTGMSPEDCSKMMDAETWMTAQEAKDMGFVDRIEMPMEPEPEMPEESENVTEQALNSGTEDIPKYNWQVIERQVSLIERRI